MANPLKVRRLSDEEGRQLQRIVRRRGGKTDKSIVKRRWALVVLASAGGNDMAAIARLDQISPDRVREMIHSFNDKGMRSLDPRWAGSRPRRITTEQRTHIIMTAKKRPASLGQPFTRWSVRKLAHYQRRFHFMKGFFALQPTYQCLVARERGFIAMCIIA